MAFSGLGSIITKRLRQKGLERPVQSAVAIDAANVVLNEWFGPDTTASVAQAVSLKQRRLCIASLDAALRYELKLREPELLAAVNRRVGSPCVEQLSVLV